uniref:YspA cpYpsA-related SLOG domain-containing protein n=1 Tax=viral metagenome TaxID=1070528 RepID=A0A6M3KDA8_9ZZZZ
MKIAIVGSRTFNNYEWLSEILLQFDLTLVYEIVSGGAKGADTLGKKFAEHYSITHRVFSPEWDKYGKSAGFIRNQTIVDNCDIVIAFWDGESRGTADTIEKAKKAKKPTFIVYF